MNKFKKLYEKTIKNDSYDIYRFLKSLERFGFKINASGDSTGDGKIKIDGKNWIDLQYDFDSDKKVNLTSSIGGQKLSLGFENLDNSLEYIGALITQIELYKKYKN